MAARWIVVDDIDNSIQYDGPWLAVTESFNNLGNFGPTFKGTLHGTNGTAGLSFPFTGSSLRVYGTNNLRNSSGILDPTWDCSVDGTSSGPTKPFQFPENNWVFCEWDGADGSHIASVNATSTGQTFWIDQIQYLPSASVSTNNPLISINHLDNAISYDSGWQALGSTANMTSKAGSIMTFEFTGTQLSWWGFIPTELPHTPTSASYSVDGQPFSSFTLKGLPNNSATIYNQMFFETPVLQFGNHQLTVIHQGAGNVTPLTITNLLIQDGNFTIPARVSSSTPVTPKISSTATFFATTPSTTPKGNSVTSSSGQVSIGGIVGGILGGLALICVIIFILIYYFKRRKEQRQAVVYNAANEVQPFTFGDPLPPRAPDMRAYPIYNEHATGVPHQNYSAPQPTHHPKPSLTNTDQLTYDPPSTRSGGSSHRGRGAAPATGRGEGAVSAAVDNITPFTFQPVRKEQLVIQERRRPAVDSDTQSSNRAMSPESQMTGGSRLLVHEDSGIRLGHQHPMTLVEVPPVYSAG